MIINPIDFIGYAILATIILFQMVDKWTIIDRSNKEKDKLLDELSKAIKAVISKNANEYVMTASIDKLPTEEKIPQEELDQEVPVDALSDDEFDKALGITRKAPKK